MLTEKDKRILAHIEDYDAITIKQCEKIFFNNINYGYDYARKRLGKLVRDGFIKVTKNISTNENLYYIDKRINYTEIVVMNFYAELVYSGARIHEFVKNASWLDGKLVSDAYCSFIVKDKLFLALIEVCLNYNKLNLHKYSELFDSGLFQKQYNGAFPKLVVIEGIPRKNPLSLPKVDLVTMDLDFSNFASVFLQ